MKTFWKFLGFVILALGLQCALARAGDSIFVYQDVDVVSSSYVRSWDRNVLDLIIRYIRTPAGIRHVVPADNLIFEGTTGRYSKLVVGRMRMYHSLCGQAEYEVFGKFEGDWDYLRLEGYAPWWDSNCTLRVNYRGLDASHFLSKRSFYLYGH